MDDRNYSKSRDKSSERGQDRKSTSEKRSRDEYYGSSSDRHHHSSSSSSSHRDKRRNYGDDRRYHRESSSRRRDRSRDRWSSGRRSSRDRDSKRSSSRKETSRSSYHRREPTKLCEDNGIPTGPKADMMMSQSNSSKTVTTSSHTSTVTALSSSLAGTDISNDPLPTAPAAYYQQYQYPTQMDPQQQATAASLAWAQYYGWSVTDYNNAYGTSFTDEQYQQYVQQYYQSQDPNSYYGYYDASYYQQTIPQQNTQPDYNSQQQQQQQQPTSSSSNSPPPPPPPLSTTSTLSKASTLQIPSLTTTVITSHQQSDSSGSVSEKMLDEVGYPCETSDDPSILFEKIGQVGEGTYGKVYKVRNGKTGKLMALKRIRMKTEKDGFPITAMREIKLLQKLKHERIVELQEIMVAKGSVYMVLEYMDHDLSGILGHPNFNFEPAHAKSLVKQMLEGLAHLHHMGILHRDIKGSNLLINNKGELKIADFGLARIFEKNRAHDYTNRVITLWYRPPELLLGATAYGPAVDIWSVGCIMLEFFTGKAVFNGTDEVTQLDSIYKIMGTPSVETWPAVKDLPWFELVRPSENYVSKFRESFESLLSPGALELSEALLSMDPLKRPTASQALEFDYFKTELPEPVMPANLLDINGDWHEFESKQRKRQKAGSAANKPGNNHVDNKSKTTPLSISAAPAAAAAAAPPPPPPPPSNINSTSNHTQQNK